MPLKAVPKVDLAVPCDEMPEDTAGAGVGVGAVTEVEVEVEVEPTALKASSAARPLGWALRASTPAGLDISIVVTSSSF